MKRLWFIFGSILFGYLLWNFISQYFIFVDITNPVYASAKNFDQRIAAATLQILIYPHEGDMNERALATLAEISGESVILTHNHWDYLQDIEKALIVNSDNQLLLELTGSEFENLIRYSDRGTLVLKAPDELQGVPARLGDARDVQVGDHIEVVQRNSIERYQVNTVLAEVVSIDTYNGLPVIRYRIIDGEMIRLGDSGGGIWYQDEVIGNTWGMYVEEKDNLLSGSEVIQTSIAALVHLDYLEFYDGYTGETLKVESNEQYDHFEKVGP